MGRGGKDTRKIKAKPSTSKISSKKVFFLLLWISSLVLSLESKSKMLLEIRGICAEQGMCSLAVDAAVPQVCCAQLGKPYINS